MSDLVASVIDAHGGLIRWRQHRAVTLADRAQCLVASPTLLAQHGVPNAPADLRALPSLDLGVPQNEHLWHLFGPEGAEATIYHRPRYITRAMLALRTAAIAGVGVVQLPKWSWTGSPLDPAWERLRSCASRMAA